MSDAVEPIDPYQAQAMLDRGEAIVVDVRERVEVEASGVVPGALTIPVGQILAKGDPASPEHEPALTPEMPVILYCGSGKRSAVAGKALVDLGYRKVFNLGGLKDWANAGLPIEDVQEQS
jgi:rhodanese-related sulfurtransferase